MSWYVGHLHSGKYAPFLARRKPTEREHGHTFSRVDGPFKSRSGAEVYARAWNLGHHITGTQADQAARDMYASRARHTRHGNVHITTTHYAVETSAAQQRALIAMRQAEQYMGSTPGTRRARKWFDEGHYSSAEREAHKALSANRKRPKKRKR
jgi:hypothetical protein